MKTPKHLAQKSTFKVNSEDAFTVCARAQTSKDCLMVTSCDLM